MLGDLEQCQVTLGHIHLNYVLCREKKEEGEEREWRKGGVGMTISHGRVYVGGYLIYSRLCTLELHLFSLWRCDIDSSVLRV